MKKTVTTACFMLVSGGVLWAWTNGAWLRTGPQEWPRVENMVPAVAPPADEATDLKKAIEALKESMIEAESGRGRDGALKEAYENAAKSWLMIYLLLRRSRMPKRIWIRKSKSLTSKKSI